MKKLLSLILVATLSISLFAACAPSTDGEKPQDGEQQTESNTVVIGIATDLKTLDPSFMYEVFGNLVAYALYDMPFRLVGSDLEPKPSLVTEDWTLDDTKKVYTFPIRKDVKFTSGNQLTSKDFLFTFNRVTNLKSSTLPYVEGIEKVEAPDEYTFVVTLKEPDASFLAKLATNPFSILDSEVVKANGGTDAADASTADTAQKFLDENSAGSGPYKLVKWTPNVEVVLEKNPDYWGQVGNVDKYIIKEIPDPNSQMQMIQTGDIDIAYTLNADNIAQLKGIDGINLVNGQSTIISFLMMNMDETKSGPLANPDVQQAIRYAIDYKGLKTLCGEGTLLPKAFDPVGFPGALSKPDDYQNIEKAKELMKKAGFEGGFETTLTAANYDSEGMSWVTIAEKVKNDLEAININVNINTTEIGIAIDEYRLGNTPFLVMHWSPDYLDISNQLAFLPGDVIGSRANWPASASPEMVELGKKITNEYDPTVRGTYAEQLQELMAENSPYAFLLQHPKSFAVRNNLKDVNYNDLNKIQLSEINVVK